LVELDKGLNVDRRDIHDGPEHFELVVHALNLALAMRLDRRELCATQQAGEGEVSGSFKEAVRRKGAEAHRLVQVRNPLDEVFRSLDALEPAAAVLVLHLLLGPLDRP
jgi:hypothetical protein